MSLGCGKRKGKVAGYGNLVLSWPHRLTDKNSSFACSQPFRLRNDNYEYQRPSEALSNLPIINFFRYFYFHRSSVSKSQSLELPFIFKKKSCMFCLERLQQVRLLFFLNVMQPSKICLSQGDAQLVNAKSSICHIMFSRHCTLRIGSPILGWTIVTPQGR